MPSIAANAADAIAGNGTESPFRPFTVVEGDAAGGIVLVCDHAGNALPPGYGTLGLPHEAERFI